MTKEDEIIDEAVNYGNRLFGEELPESLIASFGFTHGAEWADEHPDLSSLWHDASEEPEHNCTIAYATKNNKIGTLKRADKSRWSWYKEKYSIIKWAYIADLLPKGGEI